MHERFRNERERGSARSSSDIRAEYQGKLRLIQSKLEILQWKKFRAAGVCVILVGLLIASIFVHSLPYSSRFLSIPSFLGLTALLWVYLHQRAGASRLARLAGFYERGLDRLEANWQGKGHSGSDFARMHHLYQADLNILGNGSLFELLCTTRSEIGAERLASYLLDKTTTAQALSRQAAVRELRDATDLREEIALLGKYSFQECGTSNLRVWLRATEISSNRASQFFLFAGSASIAAVVILLLAGVIHWVVAAPVLIPLLSLQCVAGILWRRRIRTQLETLHILASELAVLEQGFTLMRRQQFKWEQFERHIGSIDMAKAASRIHKLERIASAFGQTRKEVFYLASFLLGADVQLVLAAESWRSEHRLEFEAWLEAWADFDALNALAGYAYEHPGYIFPELLTGDPVYEADGIGHPLLPPDRCVGNLVALNHASRFYMISGSNMSGKSTYLRALGVNAVLAAAGAPVCAERCRITLFSIGASISIGDSLRDNKSKFMAEVERLREIIRSTAEGSPVLFLIDEVFSGTNSRDRRIAAESVIRSLVTDGAVGAISTHDLALTEIVWDAAPGGVNIHMESRSVRDPLDFDYRIKAGVSQRSNALAIIEMMGI